ncbi:MAG TPA: monovalent cation/H(+) antiporter subunit G [Candidatus Aquilonibacter sp.]|nr:monovalent cation/H(+) antiporter subunit G [Candidatus Aquilonibacter sp.]
MSAHQITTSVLLAIVVLLCWVGSLGMLRMRQPTQALHYLALPGMSTVVLAAAVFIATGNSNAAWKTVFIAATLLAINSVVAHATARAFRLRQLGHWQPRDGDPIEFVRDTQELEQ